MTRQEQKKKLIAQLAHFLADNAAGKGIIKGMEAGREEDDPRPKLATEWAELYGAAGIMGYITYEDCVKHLTRLLK